MGLPPGGTELYVAYSLLYCGLKSGYPVTGGADVGMGCGV